MILPVLLDSAVRSLLLGWVVWALLKVTRLCDTRTETAIWTAVLIAALSMPVLRHHAPGWVWVPHAPVVASTELLDAQRIAPSYAGFSTWPALAWLAQHARTGLMTVYCLGFSACAIRLGAGLVLTWRLYRRATPVRASWARARNIRATAEINSPVSLAGAILLPDDYDEWSATKRSAVLAHEEAHIARGDFFVQFAALIHCAVFWFSPFAWWLQKKLAEIAETASDEAAIRHLKDRATYAEILVEVSRLAQKSPLIVAMAQTSFIERRVEHILSEAPTRSLSLPQRLLSVGLLAVLAIAVAGAKTALDPVVVAPGTVAATAVKSHPSSATEPSSRKRALESVAHGARAVRVIHGPPVASHTVQQDPDVPTYDPRALLDSVYTPKPNVVPAATVVHAGREFYIRSTEKPVADVAVTYAMERQIH